ncbi:MAG TPA: ArsC/Spx/MgsR family protein [Mycobacteriales bacterium]|jgi:arsenate reductase|nr:ArsC/Spx/MgsR family protein [Mycobacteriales bacterium]
MEVWYNPSCSKCRIATEALDEAGVTYTLRRYLDDPPTAAEIEQALDALSLQPWDITRLGEPLAKELGLADRPHDRADWIDVLTTHPQLIQRPILLASDGTAYVGRTPDALDRAVEHER